MADVATNEINAEIDALKKMKKFDLQHKCNKLGIKNFSDKKKDELVNLIKNKLEENKNISKEKLNFNLLLIDLLAAVPKDKNRTVCKRCHMPGHIQKSTKCPEYISKKDQYRADIKRKIMEYDPFNVDYTLDEFLVNISKELNIGKNVTKQVYDEMTSIEKLNLPSTHESYQNYLGSIESTCTECDVEIYNFSNDQEMDNNTWNEQIYCDICLDNERTEFLEKLAEHKPLECSCCEQTKDPESSLKFFYKYNDIFKDENTIKKYIKYGGDLDEAFEEIDDCDVYCSPCYRKINDIQDKLGFNNVINELNKKLQEQEIDQEEYNNEKEKAQKIFNDKLDQLL